MENPSIVLWIPIIILTVISITKLLRKNNSNGKPWIRIEKVKDNE
mgnify:CR=1 FL=1|tara:strand:+ start:3150 stop:3284 length:135 start_codon:yes stop_codon:yes gene_type:complete